MLYIREAVEKPLQENLNVILNDGEQLCPQCNGAKVVRAYNSFERKTVNVLCGACLGKGKLDWLEMVTGPKDDHLYLQGSGSSSCSSSGKSSSFQSTSGILVELPLNNGDI